MKLSFLLFSLFFVINITEGSCNDSVIITINKDLLQKSGRTGIFQRDSFLDGDKPEENVQTLMNITTKTNDLNDTHEQLLVHWVGDESNVIVCLAKDLPDGEFTKSSAVYISYDNGDTFVNKSEEFLINSTVEGGLATVDKFYFHPKYKKNMIFTDTKNKKIYTSKNYGHHLTKHSLEFHPSELSFHENRPEVLIIHDKIDPKRQLWISVDFGKTWHILHMNITKYFWHFSQLTGNLILERKEPSGFSTIITIPDVQSSEAKTNVILENVDDFQLFGNFMFASKQIAKNDFDLYISYKDGPFVKAEFSLDLPKQRFHVVDITNDHILLAVSHNESYSHLYVSDSDINKNAKFTLSLENVLAFPPKHSWLQNEPFADVYKVQGLSGIYIATQVISKNANITSKDIISRITFDHGKEWRPIQPPKFDNEGHPINCTLTNACSLHLSQNSNQMFPDPRHVSILSSNSAPGIILATGVIGSSLEGDPGVYISHDAGITWKQGLKDNYFFNMGDHGGILTAIKYFKSRQILYSMDEGNSWTGHTFDDDELKVYGLMSKENTTAFTIIGSTVGNHNWCIRKIDLATTLTFVRKCEMEDYEIWAPSKTRDDISHIPCVLGKEKTYQRRKSGMSCYNGRDFKRKIKTSVCECDAEDFECDFGFSRSNQTLHCIKNRTMNFDPYVIPASCAPGRFYNRTRGYRKIDGDVCIEGYASRYLPDLIPCPIDKIENFLLLAHRNEVIKINLQNNSNETLPIRGLQNTIDVEFDLKNNCVYWTDLIKKHIGRQCMSNETEILVNSDFGSVEGIALDWVSDLLYFTDGKRAKIEIIKTDMSHTRKTIVGPEYLRKPRGIAVHPMAGYVFWTDWDWNPSISRSNLDGTNIKRLFTKPTVLWPNGITIDYIAERVYWVDGKQQYIASSDLNGQHFKKLITNDDRMLHLYSIAVYNDNIFWDNFGHPNIYFANKDFGDSIKEITFDAHDLSGLKVFGHGIHEGSNPCSNKSRCSHICFGAPKGQYVCSCPDNMEMLNGHCICKKNQHVCNNGNCISKQSVCDGNNDCGDSSDEAGCSTKGCKESQFQCDSKECIPLIWKCDGDQDCKDGSDESDKNCKNSTCIKDHFHCTGGRCINLSWVCDGVADCNDGADEVNCTKNQCKDTEFQCEDGKLCLSLRFKCDGDKDCQDGSDEREDICKNVTCLEDQFQCTDKACISKKWQCDGKADCSDQSDEFNCTKKQCKDTEFQCEDNKRCLPLTWRCDGDKDCSDGADEVNCTKKSCNDTEFQCKHNNTCIPLTWLCDAEKDCSDGSDEVNCTKKQCKDTEFQCENGKFCLPLRWKCDGDKDCQDGSDEREDICKNLTCLEDQFQCTNKDCISKKWQCDGKADCSDQSDEVNCTKKSCNDTDFQCKNDNSCIPLTWLCDAERDCSDGSDEVNCTKKQCKDTEFQCEDNIILCLPLKWRCDGDRDCNDGSDEREDICKNITCSEVNCTKKSCNEDEFQCKTDDRCIPLSWRCDNDTDCKDGSDESQDTCKNQVCGRDEFQCTDRLCISQMMLCDGVYDCTDGSDEVNCPRPDVTEVPMDKCTNMFECYSGNCIPQWWVCDGSPDCSKGEDELYCHPKPSKCYDGKFHCEVDNSCIKITNVCDRIPHCINGTDEMNCNNYQELHLDVDELSSNISSLLIYWLPPVHQGVEFEYLPSIRRIDDGNLSWKNNTDWIEDTFFQFNNLEPNSRYNMTVYTRIKYNLTIFWQMKYVNAKTSGEDDGEPQYLTVQQLNNTHVQLKWQLPKQTKRNKMGYIVSITHTISSEKLQQDEHVAYTLAGNFVPGKTYTFKVSAKTPEFENEGTNVALLKFGETDNGFKGYAKGNVNAETETMFEATTDQNSQEENTKNENYTSK